MSTKAVLVYLFCFSVLAMVLSGSASAELYVYDGFDYPAGGLSGNDGGVGFKAGSAYGTNGMEAQVVAGTLSYANLDVGGNKVLCDDPNGAVRIQRVFANTYGHSGTSVWFAYLIHYPAGGTGNGWAGFKFDGRHWFGQNHASTNWGTCWPATNSAVGIVTGETHLLVQLVEFEDDPANPGNTLARKWLWVDPDRLGGADLDKADAILKDVQKSLSNPTFNDLYGDFDNDVTAYVDELRIGSSYASVTPFVDLNRVLTPNITPAGGQFDNATTVTLTTGTDGATIRYTLDGSEPTETSTLYNGPFELNESATVNARAFKVDMDPSLTATAAFEFVAAVPEMSPAPGTHVGSVDVTLTTATDGATIRYTLDGSTPDAGSTLYTAPFTLTDSTLVKARAFDEENVSATASASFTKVETIGTLPVDRVQFNGRLGDRLTKTIAYLIAQHDRTHPNDTANFDMLNPFVNRGGSTERDWDGEYAGKWLDAACLVADNTGHAGLTSRANSFAETLRGTQLPSGYMGIDTTPGGSWDMWNMWYVLYSTMNHFECQDNADSKVTAEDIGRYIVANYLPPNANYNILRGAWGGGCTVDVLDQLMRLWRVTDDADLKAGLLGLGDHISSSYGPIGAMRNSGTLYLSHAYVVNAYLGGMVMYNQNRANPDDLGWLDSVWQDEVNNHLFHTGSVGQGERLRSPGDYTLGSNKQETCATVEWMLFTERMYLATGDVKYMQQLENTVYNALLGAQSVDGMGWMYHTKMNSDRKAWFSGATRCCYWSGPRGIARMPRYAYHVDSDGLRVDFYEPSSATDIAVGGTTVDVTLDTDYPATGVVTLTLTPAAAAEFALKLRLPDWAENVSLTVNGAPAGAPLIPGQYATVERTWQAGDTVRLRFDTTAWAVERPALTGISGAAVRRGPEVLSLDDRDNPGIGLSDVTLYADPQPTPAGLSPDGRRLYACKALVGGSPDTVVLTPFADAGNDGADYKTVMPVSTLTTPIVQGDFNNDGAVNGLDIPAFKQALTVGRDAFYDQNGLDSNVLGDFNGDGAFNGLDIPGFKAALGGN